jgi:SPP1 family predicted phage head-tail adaptor
MKQIRLERWTSVQDAFGNWTESVQKFNLFAEVTRKSGSRSSLNGQTRLNSIMEFRVRFRPDFNPTGNWRVVYDGNRYTVQEIIKEKEQRYWWIIRTDGIQS